MTMITGKALVSPIDILCTIWIIIFWILVVASGKFWLRRWYFVYVSASWLARLDLLLRCSPAYGLVAWVAWFHCSIHQSKKKCCEIAYCSSIRELVQVRKPVIEIRKLIRVTYGTEHICNQTHDHTNLDYLIPCRLGRETTLWGMRID
jgi:hypothetical protein